eukprot:6938699-Alexandrium_andersonii.AAC.1
MSAQCEGQHHARVLAWRLAMREPHPSMHAFATDTWPASGVLECTRCGVSFGAQHRFSALSAVSDVCRLAQDSGPWRARRARAVGVARDATQRATALLRNSRADLLAQGYSAAEVASRLQLLACGC